MLEPLEQFVQLLPILVEMVASFVGDLERLARAFDRGFLDQPPAREAPDAKPGGSR